MAHIRYKLVAVDMDGTLLNSDNIITESTVDAVRRITDAGVIFAISTGRPVGGIKKYINQLNLKGPVITYNGAMIVDTADNTVIYEKGLKSCDARRIYELGSLYGTTMCVWSGNRLFVNEFNEKSEDYQKQLGVKASILEDFDALADTGITKLLWYEPAENIKLIQEKLKKETFESVTYCTSKPVYLEFFNSEVSKAKAMERIGEIYNISPEEMIAIGDGLNDVSMIEYAGLGVAMANAPKEVRGCADYVTDSNDNEGVRKVIDKYCL